MGFLLGLKAKLFALGAGLLAVAAFFLRLKVVQGQRDKARQKAAQARQQVKLAKRVIERQQKTAEMDAEIEQKFSHRAEEIKQDREEGKVPKAVSKDSTNDF